MRRNFAVCCLLAASALPALPAAGAQGLSFSYLELDGLHAQPDQSGAGHGGRLTLSNALSDNAFLYLGAQQYAYDAFSARRYDFGVGINSAADAGYTLFATVGWNHIGLDPRGPAVSAPTTFSAPAGAADAQDHGFGASAGIRARLAPRWEVYALARLEHNDELAKPASGEFGLAYRFSTRWSLGAAVNVNAHESDYLLALRWYY